MSRPLPSDEVHVWSFRLATPAAGALALLSADERERAARFRHHRARTHFTAGRVVTRRVLAAYLGCDPAALAFTSGPHGKPALADEARLRFNLSHSHEWAVLAVARERDVGVDVEHVQPARATDDIARRFFSPREWAALRDLPPDLRAAAFFRCWTCKEAFVKLIGDGLTFPLDAFDVAPVPGAPPALLTVHGSVEEARRWSLHALTAPPGYAAALAVEGAACRVVELPADGL